MKLIEIKFKGFGIYFALKATMPDHILFIYPNNSIHVSGGYFFILKWLQCESSIKSESNLRLNDQLSCKTGLCDFRTIV